MPYGERWRNRRRALHQNLNSKVIGLHTATLRAQVDKFLVKLLKDPKAFPDHIAQYACTLTGKCVC